MAENDDTELVEKVARAVYAVVMANGLRWHEIANSAIAAVREHEAATHAAVPLKTLREAMAVMRECGWPLAAQSVHGSADEMVRALAATEIYNALSAIATKGRDA